MIIDHPPSSVQRFFRPATARLTKPQGAHLIPFVLAIAVGWRCSKLAHLAATIKDGRHRTRLGAFLRSDWDEAALLSDRALSLLKRMKPRPGEVLELLIDDTRIAKRGRRMEGARKMWDHTQQRFVRGHIVVTAALRFRGVVLPWAMQVWLPKHCAGRSYRKTTEIAAELIERLPVPRQVKVRVLFDAFYLCPTVTKACERRGFTWFSIAARNRRFHPSRGRAGKLGERAPGWIKHRGRNVRMPRARGYARLRLAHADGHLARIGRVRAVASKRPRDPWKQMVVIATNETNLHARKIISIYEHRWGIEVMFRQLKDLGLGDYQMLRLKAIRKHLHLTALAHLLLTHHAMAGVGAQARTPHTDLELPRWNDRRTLLRLLVRRDQVRRLMKGSKHRRLRMKIEPYLMAA